MQTLGSQARPHTPSAHWFVDNAQSVIESHIAGAQKDAPVFSR